MFLLVIVFTIFIDFHVRVSIFHVPKWILLSWINFFTHTYSQRCWNSCLVVIASWRRCSAPCSFDIVFEWGLIFCLIKRFKKVTSNKYETLNIWIINQWLKYQLFHGGKILCFSSLNEPTFIGVSTKYFLLKY